MLIKDTSSGNQILGVKGENNACNYLINKGYKIQKRNFKLGRIEIDIIAEKGGATYFVEVKTRSGVQYGHPVESIPDWKKKNIMKAATYYIAKNGLEDKEIHFSVIGIDYSETTLKIEFIEDAFGEGY